MSVPKLAVFILGIWIGFFCSVFCSVFIGSRTRTEEPRIISVARVQATATAAASALATAQTGVKP